MQCSICSENYSLNKIVRIAVLSILFLMLLLSCSVSKRPKVADRLSETKEKAVINTEDQEKLWDFIKNKDCFPVLTIDSVTAVDSLKVLPASYHQIKESLLWKKAYPAEDFLQLRSYVRTMGYLFVLAIDSITAVDSLKVHPQAYTDLKENIQDCNKVFDYKK